MAVSAENTGCNFHQTGVRYMPDSGLHLLRDTAWLQFAEGSDAPVLRVAAGLQSGLKKVRVSNRFWIYVWRRLIETLVLNMWW